MKSKNPLSIIIADDHPSVKYGIKSILQDLDFISCIDEASNGIEVLKLFENKIYDIVLMDIVMHVLDGMETTTALKEKYPDVKVIAFSMYYEERYVLKMFECGACGYLLKNADKEEIIEAIKIVSKGDIFISKDISISIFQKIPDPPKTNSKRTVLRDETLREIIFLLCADKNSKQIAEILSLSKRTIDTYRDHITLLIGAKSMAGVIKYGIDHGIYDDPIIKNKFMKVLFDVE